MAEQPDWAKVVRDAKPALTNLANRPPGDPAPTTDLFQRARDESGALTPNEVRAQELFQEVLNTFPTVLPEVRQDLAEGEYESMAGAQRIVLKIVGEALAQSQPHPLLRWTTAKLHEETGLPPDKAALVVRRGVLRYLEERSAQIGEILYQRRTGQGLGE